MFLSVVQRSLRLVCGSCLGAAAVFGTLLAADAALAAMKTRTLMITPMQIIFPDRQRNVDVYVYNPTQEEISYRIDTVTLRTGPDGRMQELAPEQESAEEQRVRKMIRYAPRRATIAPGGRQVLKFMVNKPANLAPGEYRTRMILRPQPSAAKAAAARQQGAGDKSVSMDIELLVNSSFPIWIQHGVRGVVEPVGVRLVPAPKAASGLAAEVVLHREGGGSGFGNLSLHYVPTNDPGASREVGYLPGVTVQMPLKEKKVQLNLKDISRQELSGGMLRATFRPSTGTNQRVNLGEPTSRDFPVR
ncbi:MAG: hypothetical protein ACOX5Z_06350 [Desulfobulbus sp.]|jgi:hypothetical protein